MIGRTIDHFRIEAPLGAGGMGEVWLAHDLALDRRVAIKFIAASLVDNDDARRRFVREARALAALDHPYVAAVYGVGEDAERPYMVLAYVEGASLAAVVADGPLPVDRARSLAVRIAGGLAAVHARGIVHRDLKCDNVMVAAGDVPKLVDFGIALSARDTRHTQTGLSPGTPGYTAPEVLRGGEADARSDLFALGVITYRMLTGALPFPQAHPMAALHAVLNEEPAPFPEDLAPASRALEPVVRRLLDKDPGRRFAGADEAARALQGEPVPPPVTTPRAARGPRPRRRHVVAVAIVTLAVVALAVLVPRRRTTAGAATLPRSVAVLPFENLSGDASLDWMERGIPELIGTALVQSDSLDVFDTRRLAELDASRGGAEAAPVTLEVLRRRGVRRAIDGSVLRSGDRLRLQGRLLDVASGRTLHARVVDGSAGGDLLELVARLLPGLQVALEVNLTGNTEAEAWLREITTGSADAYRFYLQGHQALLESRWDEANHLLGRAIAIDSTFVLARVDQMGARWNLGDDAGVAASRAALERLRTHADERSRLQIDMIEGIVDPDPKKLVRSAAGLHRLFPENRHYTYLLGRGYHTDGQHAKCIETLAPLRAQRYSWAWTYVLTARSFAALGRPDSAAAAYALGMDVTHRDPELALVYATYENERGRAAAARGLLVEALRHEKLDQSPAAAATIHFELAKLAYAAADTAGGRTELEQSVTMSAGIPDVRGEIDAWLREHPSVRGPR